ncbi:MAG TPA: hypothetical protein VNL15_00940 [Dehalococcoidia bacterium]|nr:hypothetical protein [Dehalococcoidia bacterium]
MTTPLEKVKSQIAKIPLLRGTGPVSYNYGQWVDNTNHLLITLFGENSPEVSGFLEIVGEGAEARGWGLPLAPANPWGMLARLRRAESYLQRLAYRMENGPEPD